MKRKDREVLALELINEVKALLESIGKVYTDIHHASLSQKEKDYIKDVCAGAIMWFDCSLSKFKRGLK